MSSVIEQLRQKVSDVVDAHDRYTAGLETRPQLFPKDVLIRTLKPKAVEIPGLVGAAKAANLNKVARIRETIAAARPVGVISLTSAEGVEIERQQRERERFERDNPLCGAGQMFGCDKPTPRKEFERNKGFCFDCREKQIEENQKRERDERKAEQKLAYQKRQSLLAKLGGKLPKIRLTADQYKELKSIEIEFGTKKAKRAYEDMVLATLETVERTKAPEMTFTVINCKGCNGAFHTDFLFKNHRYCCDCIIGTPVPKVKSEQVKPQAVVTSKRKLAAIAKNGRREDGRPLSRAVRKNVSPAPKPEKPAKPNRRATNNAAAGRQR